MRFVKRPKFEIHTRLTAEQIVQRLRYALTPQVIFRLDQTVPIFTFEGKVNDSTFDIICYERLPGYRTKYSESEFGIYMGIVGYVQRIRNSGVFHGNIQETQTGAIISGYFGVSRGIGYSVSLFLIITFFVLMEKLNSDFSVNICDAVTMISVLFLLFVGFHYFFEMPYRKAIADFLHGLFEDVAL